jgi:hypothetical protein
MFKVTKRRLLPFVCILALVLLVSSGDNPRVVRASGHVEYFTDWFGDCWYWDHELQQEMGAARYYYDNFLYIDENDYVRRFNITIWYSGVCPDDNVPGSAYSDQGDGWRMVVNSPYDIKVYNQFNQQVYP